MSTQERIEFVMKQTAGCVFIVKKQHTGLMWRRGDNGYTPDITEARIFTQTEMWEKLTHSGLMDKDIVVYEFKQVI